MSKKLFTAFAILSLIITLVPAPSKAVTITNGDLVVASTACKGFSKDAVYYVSGSDLLVFPYLSVYLSWGYPSDFSTTKKVECSDLNGYNVKGYAKFRDGSAFRGTKKTVKGTYEARTVYYVENGKIRPIANCSVYNALFNDTTCKAKTYWVPDEFVDTVNYEEGPMITDGTVLPKGLFVKLPDGRYGIISDSVRVFSSDYAIVANRYDKSKAVPISQTPSESTPITGVESTFTVPGYVAITTPPSEPLSVALADTPASTTVPMSASNVPLLRVALTNGSSSNATVSEMVFKRTGLGAVADWSGLYLYDEAKLLTPTARTIASDSHEVTFATLNISVPANSTKYITLKGDVAASGTATAGDVHAFQLKSMVSTLTVSGLPVTGNAMTIGSVSLSGATISATSAPSNPTVGQTEAVLANFNIANNGSNTQTFEQITLTYTGTVARSEITNLKLTVFGESTVLASASGLESNDTVTLTLTTPYTLTSGQNRSFSLKGDIGGKRNQTIKFYTEETYHVKIVDQFYGFPVTVTNSFDSSDATQLTLQGGAVTMNDLGPNAGTVAINQSDVVLTKFSIIADRDVEIQRFDVALIGSAGLADVYPADSSDTGTSISDLRIKDCDSGTTLMSKTISTSSCVAGLSCDFGTSKDNNNTYRLTDAWTLKAGVKKNLCVTVDIGTDTELTDDGNETIEAQVWPVDHGSSDYYFRDVVTGDYILQSDVVPSYIDGETQTLSSASLSITHASTPISHTAVKGTTNDSALGVVFTAGDGSKIDIKQIGVRVHVNSAATFLTANEDTTPNGEVTKVALYDGSTLLGEKTLTNTSSSAHDYGLATFSNLNISVPKSGTKTLTIKLDYSGSITSTKYVAASVYGTNITAYDKDGNSVSVSTNANEVDGTNAPSRYVTVATAGTLTMAQDSNTPDSGIVLAGTNDVVISKIKFTASNENWTIEKMRVKLNTPANDASVSAVKITYPGSSSQCTLSSGYCNFTGLNWTVEGNTSETVTISANLKAIDAEADETGREIKLGIDYDTNFEANSASGSQVTSVGSADVFGNAMYLRATKPTVTAASSNKTLTNGELEIFKFTVAADSAGAVALKKFKFNVNISDYSTSTALTVNTWKIYDGSTALSAVWSDGSTTSSSSGTSGASVPLTDGSSTLLVELNSEREVGAGSSKTFTIKATVSNAAVYDSVTIGLNTSNDDDVITGGLADHNTELVRVDDASSTYTVDFLWSDKAKGVNHTDSYQNTYKDWTNGYLINVPTDTWTWTWAS